MSGLDTCRAIRRTGDVPIIMLTVRNTEKDKVQALDAGADDYVVKPFGAEELMARIRAALRRVATGETTPAFRSDDLVIDFAKRSVTVKGVAMRLTPKEFELLRQLVSNQGVSLSHRRLLQAVWGPDYGEEDRISACLHQSTAKKNRAGPAAPALHPH